MSVVNAGWIHVFRRPLPHLCIIVRPAASKFTVQAFAEGWFSAFGHDPVIGIKDFQGEAEFVPDTFDNASLKLTINANSLAVVNDVKEKDRKRSSA